MEVGKLELVGIGRRIAEVRDDTKQEDFAVELDVHQATLSRYERGMRAPDPEFLHALATKKNISLPWLLYGIPPRLFSDAILPEGARSEFWHVYSRGLASELRQSRVNYAISEDFVLLPHYDVRAAAGYGALVEEQPPEKWWPYERAWLAQNVGISPERLALVNVAGDSLVELRDGDIAMIDRGDTERIRDGIYVFDLDRHLYVKRLSMRGDQVVIASRHGEQLLDTRREDTHFRVIGRVVGRPSFDRL